jgi:type II secretory pathway component GspD/PulD (secretin)
MALLGAGVFLICEVRAGQCHEESQITQDTKMIRVVYPVNDLVPTKSASGAVHRKGSAQSLLNDIVQNVAPDSWAEVGGMATIQYYPLGLAIIVNQTQANHERIAQLLASMRRNQKVEVVVEARLASMTPALAEAFMAIVGLQGQDSHEQSVLDNTVFLNERQVDGWMSIFQGNRAVNTMQAPKIRGESGQQLEIMVGDDLAISTLATDAEGNMVQGETVQFVGVHGKFLPVVSADQRFVKLNIDFSTTNITKSDGYPPLKLQQDKLTKTVVLPSGGTAVCLLKKDDMEECGKHSPPVLTNIPFLNRHFTKGACNKKEEYLFLMLTTRIISSE